MEGLKYCEVHCGVVLKDVAGFGGNCVIVREVQRIGDGEGQ